jgi:hypothetical protein
MAILRMGARWALLGFVGPAMAPRGVEGFNGVWWWKGVGGVAFVSLRSHRNSLLDLLEGANVLDRIWAGLGFEGADGSNLATREH